MRERVAGLPVGEKGRGAQFHIHQVVLVAAQLAFINKLLDFKRMRLSLFQCVFGRYLLALWAWLNGLTLTDFLEMGLDPKMVAVEVKEDEVKLLPPAVADAFAGGVKFDTAADILAAHQNANSAFAALKNRIFEEAKDAYNNGAAGIVERLAAAAGDSTDEMEVDGAAPSLSAAAVRLVALAADAAGAGLVAPRGSEAGRPPADGGAMRKALARFCVAALASPPDGSVLASVDASLADRGASGLAAATRIAAGAVAHVDVEMLLAVVIYAPPPPEMTLWCKIRFHTPTVDGWNGWSRIDDFFAVIAALRIHGRSGFRSVPAWVLESPTCRAFETSGQQILAGMTLAEFTAASSLVNVFAKEAECEGVKYGTYTIFSGSDYQLAARGRAPVDKCACIVEAVEAYMASRIGA